MWSYLDVLCHESFVHTPLIGLLDVQNFCIVIAGVIITVNLASRSKCLASSLPGFIVLHQSRPVTFVKSDHDFITHIP